jgi:hypothetical protein
MVRVMVVGLVFEMDGLLVHEWEWQSPKVLPLVLQFVQVLD